MVENQYKKDIEELFGEDVLREIYGVTPYAQDDKKDLNLNLSKEIRCPYDASCTCKVQTNYIVDYANYLIGLAKSNSSDIFTNGGRDDMVCDPNCAVWRADNVNQR